MKTLREAIAEVESKIMPVNQVDHRFRVEHITFTMDGISLHASLLTSNNQDYSIQCNYSYIQKKFTDWMMMDALGSEFQVIGLVSKSLHYFVHKATVKIIEAIGYEFEE